ncbi:MAG: hypothetical protein EBU29_11730, partial [Gammaproteobacteria bacterium]|nr:hypothetical protein [Gammaproteobacteria bacterium]
MQQKGQAAGFHRGPEAVIGGVGEALSVLWRNGVDKHAPGALMEGLLEVLKSPLRAGAQGDVGRGA